MKYHMENKQSMKRLSTLTFLLIFSVILMAQDLPQRPEPPTLVNDFANALSPAEEQQLERKLVDFFASTSTQIAVVTLDDLGGYPASDYAFQLGEAWGIGDQKFDNGMLILLKPKSSSSNGEVFVAVGYGLEGAIPDATSKQIVENEMIPSFKAGQLYQGLDKATTVMIELAKGEYNYQQYAKKSGGGGFNPFLLFVLIFFIFPILFGRRRRSYYSAGNRSSLPFWLAMGMFSGAGRNHSGHFNNFQSGSGSFGGGSSFGSFGGFGGGSFGGGGAGGSW